MGFLEEKGGKLEILYLGVRNSLYKLENAAFLARPITAQATANTTLAGIKKLGLLAGSVVEVKADEVIGAASNGSVGALGVLVNDVAGNAYESSSAASSEKGVFVCGMGTYKANVYETHNFVGNASIVANYVVGASLYASQNGLLTVKQGLDGGTVPAGATVVGILTKAPGTDGFITFQLRV